MAQPIRIGSQLTVTMLLALPYLAHPAAADVKGGCNTLAGPPVILPHGADDFHSTAAVPLRAGEKLKLRMNAPAAASAEGTVMLRDEGGGAKPVLSGSAPQEIVLTIPADGLYALDFQAEGAEAVRFEVSCENQAAALPDGARPDAFVARRASRALADDTTQTNLRRRSGKPDTLDKAIKRTAILNDEGQPTQVRVTTSLQDIAAAEGQRLRNEKLDIWVEGRVSQFSHNLVDQDDEYEVAGNTGSLYFGADYLLKPGIMIGALIQLDQYQEAYSTLGAETDGQGMFFGPYASIDLGSGLLFDLRAAWGEAENELAMSDGERIAFETQRQLLRGQLSGERQLLGLQFTPSLALSVIEDRFDGELPIGEANDAVLGRLGIGSTLAYRFAFDDGGYLKPSAGLTTGWTVEQFDILALDNAALSNETGARAQAGLELGTANGVSLSASGAIEGLGEEDYSAWTGRLSLTAPLN